MNLSNTHNAGDCVTIDGKVDTFYSRCSFLQYIPNISAKYEMKVDMMCDSKTQVYCQKQDMLQTDL
jgi:hypothetical protein